MTNEVKLLLTAEDRTAAAFRSATCGLDKMTGASELAQKALSGVAAAVALGGAASAVKGTIDYADEMGKLALKAGTTTEAVSGLAYAASLSDLDNKQLAKGLRELGNDAQTGGEKLAALGISVLDTNGKVKTSDALFLEVADKLAGITDPAKRAAVATELFGDKVGPELLPLLISGSAGIKDMTAEAAKFGRVISDEAATKAAEFNDNLDRLTTAGKGVIQQLSGPMVSSLATSSSYFLKLAGDVGLARAAVISFGGAVARTLGQDDVGKLQGQARANSYSIALMTQQVEKYQKEADQGDAAAAQRVAKLRTELKQLQAEGQRITAALKGEAKSIEEENKPVVPTPLPEPNITVKSGKTKKENTSDPLGDFIGGPQVMAAIERTDAMANSAKKLYEETRTPIEKLSETEADLLRMRDLGYIKEQEYWRGRSVAIEKYTADIKQLPDPMGDFIKGDQVQAAIDRTDALAASAKKIYEETRTPLEQLAKTEADLQSLRDLGYIKEEEYWRARAAASKQYDEQLNKTSEQAKRLGDTFANTFDTAFKTGMDLDDLLKKLVFDAINIQFLTPASQAIGGVMGNAVSSMFSSFDGGGYTGSGNRTGGLDGKGGFLAVMHPNETVLDHTRGQGVGGGTTIMQTITVDARGADAGVESRIRAAMAQTKAETLAAVQAKANRGGSFAAALGRG